MPVALPKLRVGDPLRHEALSVFPLFSEATSGVDYLLSDVALADESLLVEEVNESGSVPELLVENKGDVRVLFLEGEVAIGEKVVAVDLFDKPPTCQKIWDRILSGVVFDALEAGQTDKVASVADVEQLFGTTADLPWEQAEAVGEGEEYRAESKRGDLLSPPA